MTKANIIAAAGAFALAALASAATSQLAMADTPPPTCHRVNPYVACTHGFKAKTLSPQSTITHSQLRINKVMDTASPALHPVRRLEGH
jgi:hypothetical protein